jgi:hypothetical protein
MFSRLNAAFENFRISSIAFASRASIENCLFRKICGLKLAFEHCGVLESCPQRADSRMGLKLVGEAGCCGQLSLPSHVGLMNRRTQAKSLH